MKKKLGVIVLVGIIVSLTLLSVYSSPSNYWIGEKQVFMYGRGIGKPGDSGLGGAKTAALNNARAAVIEGVYEKNIETSFVSAHKEVVGPLSFIGIGKRVIRGSILPGRLQTLSCKDYYKKTKEGKKELMKVVVEVRIPIVN
ncbi:MAG: hypothetical protein V5A57_03470 [Candidatus Paceibacterota bacterium]